MRFAKEGADVAVWIEDDDEEPGDRACAVFNRHQQHRARRDFSAKLKNVLQNFPLARIGKPADVAAAAGSEALDAATLLIPLMEFLPAHHPRVAGTLAAIGRELVIDGVVHRFDPSATLGGRQLPIG
jgi:GH15 family glucan-1,4-alpha-glucosidase